MLNYPQLRERSVVLLVGNLLKESSMVNLPVRLSLDQISDQETSSPDNLNHILKSEPAIPHNYPTRAACAFAVMPSPQFQTGPFQCRRL